MKGFGELRLPIFEEIASASVLGDQQCQKRHPYLLNALSHSRYDNQQRRLHKCTLQPSIVTSQSIEKNLVVHGCSACTMVISSQGTKGCDAPMISNGLFLSASKLSKSSIESSAPYYLALTDSNMSQKRKRGVIDAAVRKTGKCFRIARGDTIHATMQSPLSSYGSEKSCSRCTYTFGSSLKSTWSMY